MMLEKEHHQIQEKERAADEVRVKLE